MLAALPELRSPSSDLANDMVFHDQASLSEQLALIRVGCSRF